MNNILVLAAIIGGFWLLSKSSTSRRDDDGSGKICQQGGYLPPGAEARWDNNKCCFVDANGECYRSPGGLG